MRESLIRWKKDDYSALRKAVNEFNKKVQELESLEIENLPEKISYKETKQNILTRKEFNRRLKEIEKFQKSNQQDLITLESGEQMTRWEKNVLSNAKRRSERRLTKELFEAENDVGVGLGSKRANEIRATLESIQNFGKVKNKRLKERLMTLGQTDIEMKRAKVFQENFIKAYKNMGGKYSRKIVEYAKSFSNPMDFWNAIKDTPLVDLRERYDSTEGLVYFGFSENDIREYYTKILGIT